MGTPREEYEHKYATRFISRLGFGRDGSVWYTGNSTAVKLFDDPAAYARERHVYVLLHIMRCASILGHQVPRLVRHDDALQAIEMTIVKPPFFLDFASAYPEDEVPDFPQEVWDEWNAERAEMFDDRWPDVLRLAAELKDLIGVVLLDLNPGNIKFA